MRDVARDVREGDAQPVMIAQLQDERHDGGELRAAGRSRGAEGEVSEREVVRRDERGEVLRTPPHLEQHPAIVLGSPEVQYQSQLLVVRGPEL